MKVIGFRLLFALFVFGLSPLVGLAQGSDCDQAIKISNENIDLSNPNRNFVSAYENLALAKKICGEEKLPMIDSLIMVTVKLMSEETERVKRAERIAKKQTEEANKAKNETIVESQNKIKIRNAELNSRYIIDKIPKDKTMALQMADYNLFKNSDQPSAAIAFQKALDFDHAYYKLVLRTEHYRTIEAVKFSPDSKHIFTYNSNNTVQVFDMNGIELFNLIPDEQLSSLRFTEDSKNMIVENILGDSQFLRSTYDLEGNLIRSEEINSENQENYVSKLNDFDLSDSSLVSISQKSINPKWTYTLLKEKEQISAIDVSEDGNYLIIGFESSVSLVWRISPIRDLPLEIEYKSASETLINQLNAQNGSYYQPIWKERYSDEEQVSAVTFSRNRPYFLVATYFYYDYNCSFRSIVYVYNRETLTFVKRIKVNGLICTLDMPTDKDVLTKLANGRVLNIDLMDSNIVQLDSLSPPELKLDLQRILFELNDYQGRFSGTNTIPVTDWEKHGKYIDSLIKTISIADSIFYDNENSIIGRRKVNHGEYALKAQSGNMADLSILQKEVYSNITVTGIEKIAKVAFSQDKDLTAIALIRPKYEAAESDFRSTSGQREIVINLSSKKEKWTKEFKVDDIGREYSVVNSLSITHNNRYLSMCYDGGDNSMVMWDIDSTKLIAELSSQYHLLHGTFLANNKSLVVKGSPGTSVQYISNSEDQKRIPLHTYPSSYIFTDLSQNEELLLIGGDQNSYNTYADLWDLKKELKIATIVHTRRIDHGKFSPDGKYALLGAKDGTLILFDVNAKKVLKKIAAHDGYINAIGFSCNGEHFYSNGEDGFLKCWNLNGLEVMKEEFSGYSTDIQCGPTGENIFVTTTDQIRIFPTINRYIENHIRPRNWHSLMNLKMNDFEANTLEDYQILSYEAERNRNWKDAQKYYEEVFKKNKDAGYKSRAMMMEATSMISDIDRYIDTNNGRLRQQVSKQYYSEVEQLNNQVKVKLHKADGGLDFYYMKNAKNFSKILVENQKAFRMYQIFGMPLIGKEENNYLRSQFIFFCILAGRLDEAEGFSEGEELPILNLIQKRYKKAERLYLLRYKMPDSGVYKHVLQTIGYIPYDEIEYQNNVRNKIKHRFYLEEINFYTELGLISTNDPEVQRIKKMIIEYSI